MTLADHVRPATPGRATRPAGAGTLGWAGGRLLAGPAEGGAEPLGDHLRRLGPLPPAQADGSAVSLLEEAAVRGRGGGEFPFAGKLRAALCGALRPLVVVNGCEGEPASRKDRTLLERRPHLVLDGAAFAAAACGASEAVVYLEPGLRRARAAVAAALGERHHAGLSEVRIGLATAPACFVAGESTAVVSGLEGAGALPGRRRVPVAAAGVRGRPTVVGNTETLAHVALAARFGPDWFRTAGSEAVPGSSLVTLAGGVAHPGLVVEVLGGVEAGDLLRAFGGVDAVPEAVLVGGYGGRLVAGSALWGVPVERAALRAAGAALGCGVVAPVPADACALAVVERLLAFLAGESSGQCGSCVFGLPSLARELADLVAGRCGRGGPRRLLRHAIELEGRGGCAHPDAAIGLLVSALQVCAEDASRHARGRRCLRGAGTGWFPLRQPELVR